MSVLNRNMENSYTKIRNHEVNESYHTSYRLLRQYNDSFIKECELSKYGSQTIIINLMQE